VRDGQNEEILYWRYWAINFVLICHLFYAARNVFNNSLLVSHKNELITFELSLAAFNVIQLLTASNISMICFPFRVYETWNTEYCLLWCCFSGLLWYVRKIEREICSRNAIVQQ
jgi:hypothetical protein